MNKIHNRRQNAAENQERAAARYRARFALQASRRLVQAPALAPSLAEVPSLGGRGASGCVPKRLIIAQLLPLRLSSILRVLRSVGGFSISHLTLCRLANPDPVNRSIARHP